MELLNKVQIEAQLASQEKDTLFIEPLLEKSQIGQVTVDLRLGYDFLVSIYTKNPVVAMHGRHYSSPIESYYQPTRRDLGDSFILYPQQSVLTTTIEYVALPENIYLDILSRSSYTRLGIMINTMVQPGFRGTLPLELYNHGHNPLELIVGSRIVQTRFFELKDRTNYHAQGERKYAVHIRPEVSKADKDNEIGDLIKIKETRRVNIEAQA